MGWALSGLCPQKAWGRQGWGVVFKRQGGASESFRRCSLGWVSRFVSSIPTGLIWTPEGSPEEGLESRQLSFHFSVRTPEQPFVTGSLGVRIVPDHGYAALRSMTWAPLISLSPSPSTSFCLAFLFLVQTRNRDRVCQLICENHRAIISHRGTS